MEKIISINIKAVRKKLELTQDKLAQPLGISGKSVCSWEKGRSVPSEPVWKSLESVYKINRNFVEKNEGEMFLRPLLHVAETQATFCQVASSDELGQLIGFTHQVLTSKTEYSQALAANIRAFHNALETEKQLSEQEKKIEALIEENKAIHKKIEIMETRLPAEEVRTSA